jgi:pimeloyl-ACP methyl ester carboxylesterase
VEHTRIPVAEGVSLAVNVWPGPGDRGDGGDSAAAPFLLVHGLASNARMWDGVADVLSRAGHPVAAVDLRGHGLSDKPDHGYDFPTVAADLQGVAAGVGFERPVVVGQSWGGNLAVDLAAHHGQRLRGAAAVDGGTIELSRSFPVWDDCASALAPPPLAGMPVADLLDTLRRAHPDWPESGIHGMAANFEVRADDTVAPWLTFERHMQILRSLWEHRPSMLWAAIEVPVLFIPTEANRDDADTAVCHLRKGRVVALAGHHDLHAQHPDKVAGALLDAVADGFFA